MNKIKNFMDKPVTWGGYLKLCGYSTLISMGITAGYWAYLMHGYKKLERKYDWPEDKSAYEEDFEN